ncbi:unnamed protein product, partial [Meganyctiphanes norvegica]
MSIKIIFDTQPAVYFSGQTIVGHVQFINHDSISIRGVAIKFKGQGNTIWKSVRTYHAGSEEYYVGKVYLFGNDDKCVSRILSHRETCFSYSSPKLVLQRFFSYTEEKEKRFSVNMSIKIIFDTQQAVYFGGQTIVGRVQVINHDSISTRVLNHEGKETRTFTAFHTFQMLMLHAMDQLEITTGQGPLKICCDIRPQPNKI